jgi:hypothetical protein
MTLIAPAHAAASPPLTLATPVNGISPHDLRAAALSGEELAVIDVREGDAYVVNGHISIAVELPLSELELKAYALLPRLGVRLVVTDR